MSTNTNKLMLSGIYQMGKTIRENISFSVLNDTPTGYLGHSGDYLIVNDQETGIHFTGIEKIAQDLTDYGLPVKPTEYDNEENLPAPAIDYDGQVVQVGCQLYISCEGEWTTLSQSSDNLPLSEQDKQLYPACVTTVGDALSYTNYIDTTLNENSTLIFQAGLNGQTVDDVLSEVCMFQSIEGQSNNTSSEGTWQNITNNYNFASCLPTVGNGWNDIYSTRRQGSGQDNLRGPGTVCEFNRDGTILALGWSLLDGDNTPYIDIISPNFNENKEFTGTTHIAGLRSNIATTLLWGRSTSIDDDGTTVVVTDLGVTNANGGHGAIVVYDINIDTNTATEKQIIYLPLTNSDYLFNDEWYNRLSERTMNARLSGDGKTLVVQFLHNVNATNPKSIFIYNYNDSTQMFELHQTINGIGFQDIRLSKDGSTLVVKCGYHLATAMTNVLDAKNDEAGYFHGLKIFKRDSQNIWEEQSSLTYFDLGIQEAVKKFYDGSNYVDAEGNINWDLPIGWALGTNFDITRDGTAILYQLPDTLAGSVYLNPMTNGQGSFDYPEYTGPIGVITWNGTNWRRLGSNLLFDNGDLGFYMNTFEQYKEQTTSTTHGSISDDGTLIMALSRNMYVDFDFEVKMNFLKWNGSEWIKTSVKTYDGNEPELIRYGGYCMSKAKHPDAGSIVGFHGYDSTQTDIFHFSEECSTNLVGGGTISNSSNVSSCGVVRIKDTGYKWGLFPNNTEITIQAFPSTACSFEGWDGQNITDPNALETTVTINSNVGITGKFNIL